MKFDGGHICKECYAIVSNNFTETITKKNYDDLMKIYNNYKENSYDIGEFERTRKIADLILFDDNHNLICLPNNRRISQKKLYPEIFSYKDIVKCELRQNNETINIDDSLFNEISKDKNKLVKNLEIKITLNNPEKTFKSIQVFSTPVRVSSFAYTKSIEFAKEIVNELNKIINLSN
ncbi:MAG: hypothetical protein AB6733_23390 [Clostridiaceae bacterium]